MSYEKHKKNPLSNMWCIWTPLDFLACIKSPGNPNIVKPKTKPKIVPSFVWLAALDFKTQGCIVHSIPDENRP